MVAWWSMDVVYLPWCISKSDHKHQKGTDFLIYRTKCGIANKFLPGLPRNPGAWTLVIICRHQMSQMSRMSRVERRFRRIARFMDRGTHAVWFCDVLLLRSLSFQKGWSQGYWANDVGWCWLSFFLRYQHPVKTNNHNCNGMAFSEGTVAVCPLLRTRSVEHLSRKIMFNLRINRF